jgi:hypothetical protein
MKHLDPLHRQARRPAAALIVLALHLLLLLCLWHTLRPRPAAVARDSAALVWIQPVAPARLAPVLSSPSATAAPRASARSPLPPAPRAAAAPARWPTGESTWVEPVPAAPAPVAAASAASAPPPTRLLDSEATRAAIREAGRQPLLHERAAAATQMPIMRTDTALAQGTAEAGRPDCMKDPAAAAGQIGPIAIGGLFGLPFLAARVVTGRCAQ